MSHFEEGKEDNKLFILTITDRCTRWSEVYRLRNLKSTEIIRHFRTWLEKHPIPESCLTDQGRQYISKEFNNFLEENKIKHVLATAYNPTGNSISERINQTISRVLQTSQHQKVCKVIEKINFVLQNQHNRMLGAAPHELCKQFSVFDPISRNLPDTTALAARKAIALAEEANKKLNSSRKNYIYKQGEIVFKLNPIRDKLSPIWLGPYKIARLHKGDNTMDLEADSHRIRANVKQIRPY